MRGQQFAARLEMYVEFKAQAPQELQVLHPLETLPAQKNELVAVMLRLYGNASLMATRRIPGAQHRTH